MLSIKHWTSQCHPMGHLNMLDNMGPIGAECKALICLLFSWEVNLGQEREMGVGWLGDKSCVDHEFHETCHFVASYFMKKDS